MTQICNFFFYCAFKFDNFDQLDVRTKLELNYLNNNKIIVKIYYNSQLFRTTVFNNIYCAIYTYTASENYIFNLIYSLFI